MWTEACAAVVPCLNEAGAISSVVEEVKALLPAVIVVDDGSTDGSRQLALAAGAEVVSHSRRQGKGAALTTGWRRAAERGFTWVISLDGDGQHDPREIPAFWECAERLGPDLIVGNRMGAAHSIPRMRRAVNQWMSRQLSRMTHSHLPDSQCGFRLMRLAAWSRLAVDAAHYEIESEVLLRFLDAGLRIEFVPIRVIYGSERSKIHPVVDTWRWLAWRLRARRQPAGGSDRVTQPGDQGIARVGTFRHLGG